MSKLPPNKAVESASIQSYVRTFVVKYSMEAARRRAALYADVRAGPSAAENDADALVGQRPPLTSCTSVLLVARANKA